MNKKNIKNQGKPGVMSLLGRLLKFMFKYYKIQLVIVAICITLNSMAAISSSIFIQILVDDVIEPGIASGWESVKAKFYSIIGLMAGIYVVGLICSFIYSRLMAYVTQGFLYHLRRDMFEKMQSLPIKFFDTNTHGDIMSCYTNDTDAIRQLISQSLPQAYAALVAMITLMITMLVSSVWLTLVVLIGVAIMMLVTQFIGGKSEIGRAHD